MTSPSSPWSSWGRQTKLALARRDPHVMRIHLEGLDHAIRQDVLVRCDRYAAAERQHTTRARDAMYQAKPRHMDPANRAARAKGG
jgi:hypothetical protein